MTSASDLAEEISQLIPCVKRGSLVVFGDIFGGRIDNIHTVTGAKALDSPERLVVEFDEGETLEVWDPARPRSACRNSAFGLRPRCAGSGSTTAASRSQRTGSSSNTRERTTWLPPEPTQRGVTESSRQPLNVPQSSCSDHSDRTLLPL